MPGIILSPRPIFEKAASRAAFFVIEGALIAVEIADQP
jgi:hypothetical protein